MAKASRDVQSKPPSTKAIVAKPRTAAAEKAPVRATGEKVAGAGWAADLIFDVREPKLAVSLRLDADVLRFFRGFGSGYQTRINEVLKAFMQARGGADAIENPMIASRTGRTSGGNGKRAAR